MSPVMRVDPNTGESLDKAKTVEQAAHEEASRLKALEEYKQRVKTRKPRKKKIVDEDIEIKPGIVLVKKDIPVKVNPLEAPNGEVVVEELLEPLNTILDEIEHKLQLITKGFKIKRDPGGSKIKIPKEFVYKPGVTRVNDGEDAFTLVKPSGVTSLKFDDFKKDVYLDRVLLNPIEIRELLKYPDKAGELLENLVIHSMWKNLWETKKLDSSKKYIGNHVGTLKRPSSVEGDKNYARKYTGDIDFIEIRLYSDITLLSEVK